jgi:hypothetical protein
MKGRDTIEIDHPAGEEIQWDWFGRRNAPWGARPKSFSAPRPLGAHPRCALGVHGPGPSHGQGDAPAWLGMTL